MVACAGSSSALASSSNETPSFASFFECIFGVRLFQCAEGVGSYTVNTPDSPGFGTVYGDLTYSNNGEVVPGYFVYLGDENGLPLESYNTTADANGHYQISDIPYGSYNVYYCYDQKGAELGYGYSAGSADLTELDPYEHLDITVLRVLAR